MTLSELASLICLKVRQTDDAALAACKKFIARRAEMIWNSSDFKETKANVVVTLSADGTTTLTDSVWIPSRGTLLLPPDIDRVLAVRSNEREMVNEPMATYFRHDVNTLANSGTPWQFHLLPPVVWEFTTARTIWLTPASTETGNYRLVTSADGTSKTVSTGALTARASIASVLTIALANKSSNVAAVPVRDATILTVTGAGTSAVNGTYTTTDSITYTHSSGLYTIYYYAGTWYLRNASLITLYYIQGSDFPNLVWTEYTGSLPVPTVDYGTVFSMALLDSSAPVRQRIRLVEMPSDDVTLRILFKSKFPAFEDDNDPCPLQSAENALIAFGSADMLQRERQYAKAQLMQQEGQALLGLLVANETQQQANRPRLIPAEGYGGENFQDQGLTF